ncbi:PREDICTED: furin-like [Condylura cristata]|uniref:furin-like n=1 Tax=Condylura cristata TaxID=143302 RepID=UPI00033430F7|nr:PREDICTED: furin-like [Condylura cristata]
MTTCLSVTDALPNRAGSQEGLQEENPRRLVHDGFCLVAEGSLAWVLWVAAAAGVLVLLAAEARGQKVFTNTWAVRVAGGPSVADSLARKHGFLNLGQIFGDYYHFWHRAVTKRSLSPHRLRHSRLEREPQVRWLEQQVAKRRSKRDVYQEPTDPKFPQQWYLSGVAQRDLNVKAAWAQGYTGRGIVVSILDDGIEKNHPDLAGNYVSGAR